jgi:hypothetical protein
VANKCYNEKYYIINNLSNRLMLYLVRANMALLHLIRLVADVLSDWTANLQSFVKPLLDSSRSSFVLCQLLLSK